MFQNLVDNSYKITFYVVIFYFLAMIVVGGISARRSSGILGFFLAGRSIRAVMLTATLSATIVGASSTLGMAGMGFQEGLTGAWWMLSGTIGLCLLAFAFAEKVRATGCYTLPELVGTQYDERVRTAASLLIVVSWTGVIAAQIIASGKLLSTLFSGSPALFMAISALVFILYTAGGGQNSIVKTDMVQFLILLAGIMLLSARVFDTAGCELLRDQSFPLSPARGAFDVISLVAVVGSMYIVGPDIYSRLLSAQDPATAKRSTIIAALILIPLAFIITALGICAQALCPGISPEQALPVLMIELLSPLEVGVLAAALLSALMSSADTTLLTSATIFTLDIYKRARPKSEEAHLMKISRVSILLIGSLALIVSLYSPGIIATLLAAYTLFAGGMIVPVIAGFFREQLGLTSEGALAALLGGGGTAVIFGQKYPLLGMAVSAVLLVVVSRGTR